MYEHIKQALMKNIAAQSFIVDSKLCNNVDSNTIHMSHRRCLVWQAHKWMVFAASQSDWTQMDTEFWQGLINN